MPTQRKIDFSDSELTLITPDQVKIAVYWCRNFVKNQVPEDVSKKLSLDLAKNDIDAQLVKDTAAEKIAEIRTELFSGLDLSVGNRLRVEKVFELVASGKAPKGGKFEDAQNAANSAFREYQKVWQSRGETYDSHLHFEAKYPGELDKAIAAVFEDIKEKQGADKYKSEPLKPGKPYNVLFYAMCTQKFNYIKRSRQDAPAGAAAPTTPAAAVAPTTPAAAAAAAAPTFLSAVAAASNTQSSAHMTPAMPGPCASQGPEPALSASLGHTEVAQTPQPSPSRGAQPEEDTEAPLSPESGDALPNIDAVKLKHWKGTRTAHKLKFGKEPILAAGQVYPLAISTPSRDTEALMVGSGRIIAAEDIQVVADKQFIPVIITELREHLIPEGSIAIQWAGLEASLVKGGGLSAPKTTEDLLQSLGNPVLWPVKGIFPGAGAQRPLVATIARTSGRKRSGEEGSGEKGGPETQAGGLHKRNSRPRGSTAQ